MKQHTTNYHDAFIEVAEDTPVKHSEIPPLKGEKTIANLQYEMISQHPYEFDSDEVIFRCYAMKNQIPEEEMEEARVQFFSKGQACLRASPLTKRYGFGIHSNKDGKIALYGMESEEYKRYISDTNLKVVKAMRSKRG